MWRFCLHMSFCCLFVGGFNASDLFLLPLLSLLLFLFIADLRPLELGQICEMSYTLTRGAILDAYNNKTEGKPTVQVLDVKQLPGANVRYRLVISDGEYYQQAMLATQNNHLVDAGKLKQFCVIQLTDHICNEVKSQGGQTSRKIVIVLQLTPIDPGPVRLAWLPFPVFLLFFLFFFFSFFLSFAFLLSCFLSFFLALFLFCCICHFSFFSCLFV